MSETPAELEVEVQFHGIDEGQEPGEELLVDGMGVVSIVCSAVGELHDAAELIALAAGGSVKAGGGIQDAGNVLLETVDLVEDALLLLPGDCWLPAEREHVDEHGISVTIALWNGC